MSSNECRKLKIEQLAELHNLIAPVAYVYKRFGSQIQVENHILLEIEQTNCDFSEKLYKVLEYRLKQLPLLTWHDIVRALRSPAVHEEFLASEIESQYIPCSSSQSQLASGQSSTTIDSDGRANTPAQIMQHHYSPYQSQHNCKPYPSVSESALHLHDSRFPNTTHPPQQWYPLTPQLQMYPSTTPPQMHPPPPHPRMYPPPQMYPPPPHPQVYPPPQMYPPPPHPQVYPPPPHPRVYPPPPQRPSTPPMVRDGNVDVIEGEMVMLMLLRAENVPLT